MSKVYGYVRVSTQKQSIERQVRNIKAEYPNAIIIEDEFTGTKLDRPGWKRLYKAIKPKDTIVFDSVSRMCRNAEEGFALYQKMYEQGITLVFLKEPHINTDNYHDAARQQIDETGNEIADIYIEATNRVLMILAKRQIELAFIQAEKEVADLHQRTREGIETARLKGKQIGQKPGNTLNIRKAEPIKAIIRAKSKYFDGSNSDDEVMAILARSEIEYVGGDGKPKRGSASLSRNTYYKYKNELRAERA